MFRSMFAAVSGLRNHQTFLDVIGNNIANVNTVGFKSSRFLFSDIMSQLTRAASAPTEGQGGINPTQIGLGVQIGGTETVQTQGNLQSTGRTTDLAIQGDGFFVLYNGLQNIFSRDGSFDVTADGTLVSQLTGLSVRGWIADATGSVDTSQPVGAITIPFGEAMSGQPSTAVTVRGNLDAGLNGYGSVQQSNRSGGTGTLSGVYSGTTSVNYVVRIASVTAGTGEATSLEVSTDGGATFPPGNTVTVSGGNSVSIGNGISIAVATDPDNAVGNTYAFTASPPTLETNVGVYDSLGTLHNVKIRFTKTGATSWTWVPVTSEPGVTVTPATASTISFSPAGAYTGQQPAGTIVVTPTNGANPVSLSLDLSNLSQLSGAGEAQATANGAPAGSLVSFSIGESGEIRGTYTNGLSSTVGQIALAKFANPAGLIKTGENHYEISANSGEPSIGAPGSGSRGKVTSGYLEMSNVDLAQQFTNMIMASRGFQANSRVITTVEEMLQDLVNLKR